MTQFDAKAAFTEWANGQGMPGLTVDEHGYSRASQTSWMRFRREDPEGFTTRRKYDFDISKLSGEELFDEFVCAWNEDSGWANEHLVT